MSCPLYKEIPCSQGTRRDWNFSSLHHLYVSRCARWQIAIPHPIRSGPSLPPCFSFFARKMTLNKGRQPEWKRKALIPPGSSQRSTVTSAVSTLCPRWRDSKGQKTRHRDDCVVFLQQQGGQNLLADSNTHFTSAFTAATVKRILRIKCNLLNCVG